MWRGQNNPFRFKSCGRFVSRRGEAMRCSCNRSTVVGRNYDSLAVLMRRVISERSRRVLQIFPSRVQKKNANDFNGRGAGFNGMDAPARHGISCAKVEVSSNHSNRQERP